MKLKIHYGPNFRQMFAQEQQIANRQFEMMVEAMDKIDPEGRRAHEIAGKYREKDNFLAKMPNS